MIEIILLVYDLVQTKLLQKVFFIEVKLSIFFKNYFETKFFIIRIIFEII